MGRCWAPHPRQKDRSTSTPRPGPCWAARQTWAGRTSHAFGARAFVHVLWCAAVGSALHATEPVHRLPDPLCAGHAENGGVYVHAACWAVLAERSLHGVQAAYDLWRTFCPALHGEAPGDYGGEPYVMPGNVDGPLSPRPGRAGWTWYTGSAGWYLRATIEAVLGIEAGMEGLRVLRDLPAGWEGFRMRRHFRGAIYEISVRLAGPGQPSGCRVNGIICMVTFCPSPARKYCERGNTGTKDDCAVNAHELAGKPVPVELLINIPRLVSAYYTGKPDALDPAQSVSFGASGHRGSSLRQLQ